MVILCASGIDILLGIRNANNYHNDTKSQVLLSKTQFVSGAHYRAARNPRRGVFFG